MTDTELIAELLARLDRLTDVVERMSDTMEQMAHRESRIQELEARLRDSLGAIPAVSEPPVPLDHVCPAPCVPAKPGPKNDANPAPAVSEHAADDSPAGNGKSPTDMELTKIDTILLSMDAAGKGEAAMARQLNSEGLDSIPGGKWTESAVRSRLIFLKS